MKPLPSWAAKFYQNICSIFAILWFCASSLIPFIQASAQSNAITLPRNLGELVSESQVVVQGWVTSATLEPHEQLKNLTTVVVTLQVEEVLKGENQKTLVFRQAVIDKRDQQQFMGYRTGQHVLLVLIKPSKYGLTSPAGMEQGRFLIGLQRAGELTATNGLNNGGLFRGLNPQLLAKGIHVAPEVHDMLTKPGTGPVSLEHLKGLIRSIVAADSTK